ncbi:hypothetical protein SPJ2_1728 [Streptococcus parauberis KRS-02109]|uniref:Uncharacterized protein n=1 Tax=Streptococcus parauberis NCFD 2020 TaxID=873447 RepID=F1YXM8_9STRE|nr:hypothetical protein SPB_1357 [Streptococcus parauberis NCFD 2020]EMF48515.1 hypothetical protein SPJ2_1728 [Streptococcus parauberis KRS-02109]
MKICDNIFKLAFLKKTLLSLFKISNWTMKKIKKNKKILIAIAIPIIGFSHP